MMAFDVTELQRQVANLIRLGRVEAIQYGGAIPRVRVNMAPIVTDWLPLMTLRAGPDQSWWPVEVGEQVLVFSPGGELNQGVVIGSLNQVRFPAVGNSVTQHRTTYADGAVLMYDREAHYLQARLPDGATTELVSSGGINIVGDVTVVGNITASGDITDKTRSMAADRSIFNVHLHPGISRGRSRTDVTDQSQ